MSATLPNWAHKGRRIQRQWSMVPNSIMRDPSLAPISKTVWVILHGYAPDFSWTKETLATQTNVGGHQLRKAFRELQECGLLEREPIRNAKGQMTGWRWYIHEELADDRLVENLPDGSDRLVENLPDGDFEDWEDEDSPQPRHFSDVDMAEKPDFTRSKTYQTVQPQMDRMESTPSASKNAIQKTKENTKEDNNSVLCMGFDEFEQMSVEMLHGVNIARPPARALSVLENKTKDEIEAAFAATAKANRPSWAYFEKVLFSDASKAGGGGGGGGGYTETEKNLAIMYRDYKKAGIKLSPNQESVLNKVFGTKES